MVHALSVLSHTAFQAKLERMTLNPSKAIEILKGGLLERPVRFVQADALVGVKNVSDTLVSQPCKACV